VVKPTSNVDSTPPLLLTSCAPSVATTEPDASAPSARSDAEALPKL
jgi:hypothetical protein